MDIFIHPDISVVWLIVLLSIMPFMPLGSNMIGPKMLLMASNMNMHIIFRKNPGIN